MGLGSRVKGTFQQSLSRVLCDGLLSLLFSYLARSCGTMFLVFLHGCSVICLHALRLLSFVGFLRVSV